MDKAGISMATGASALVSLGSRLREAVRTRNWGALAHIDADIAALLAQLDIDACKPVERAALQQLRQTHEQALEDCRLEAQRVGQTLEQMRQRREGWQAYAQAQEWGAYGPRTGNAA